MRFDLTRLARRPRGKRAVILRDIPPPAMFATDLYRAVFAPVVALWQRRSERILAEYGRSLSALTTDSASDLNSELDEAAAEMSRLLLVLQPALRDWAVRYEAWFRGKWRGAVLSASGVDLGTILTAGDVTQTVEQAIAWNVSLVKDVSAQAQQRIGNAVFAGLQNRSPAREVAAQIREAVGMARGRSQRIAADQLSKITADLASERRAQAGLSVYEWRHSQKRHPRTDHQARNGLLYSSDPDMIGREIEGKTVNREVEASDRAGRPPFCGCRELAVMVWDD